MTIEINETLARRVLELVDVGLVSGLGKPIPGQMCVEAAINYAFGDPHGDKPKCVAPALRRLKIRLNDAQWSSKDARTKGLRRLALAQLGSAGMLDEQQFTRRVVRLAIQVAVPQALRAAASICKDADHKYKLLRAASDCEADPTRANAVSAKKTAYAAAAAAAYAAAAAAAYAAAAAAYAAAAAAAAAYAAADAASVRDKSLADFCEKVVEILIDMKAPGCQWLWLTMEAT